MDHGTITVVALAMAFLFLGIRWRVSSVPNWLSSAIIGASLAVLLWTWLAADRYVSCWQPEAVGATLGIVLNGLVQKFWKSQHEIKQSATSGSTFAKIDGGSEIYVEDSYSSADTFYDVKGFSKASSKRNRHKPGTGNKSFSGHEQ